MALCYPKPQDSPAKENRQVILAKDGYGPQLKTHNPIADHPFRFIVWTPKFSDLFFRPRHHLKKVPPGEETIAVDYGCGSGHYTMPLAEIIGPGGKVFAIDILHSTSD